MPDIANRYASAETLAKAANTRVGVCQMLRAAAGGDVEVVKQIRSPALDAEPIRRRVAVMWAANRYTNASTTEIGRALNRDHSQVVRGLDSAEALLVRDGDFRALTRRIGRAMRDAVPVVVATTNQAELPL